MTLTRSPGRALPMLDVSGAPPLASAAAPVLEDERLAEYRAAR